MIQQGIVETISERHVGRLLQEAEELELMVALSILFGIGQ
jgi:hypothetical protein